MRNLTSYMALLALVVGVSAKAELWPNRPNVVRAAERLAEEVERFDTALHEIHAPNPVIEKVHHFEETVTEFVEIAMSGTYQEAYSEMAHIRQDMQLIRDLFLQYPQLLSYPKVNLEWRHVRTMYRNLDHQMFQWSAGRLSPEGVRELEREVAEVEAFHASNQ